MADAAIATSIDSDPSARRFQRWQGIALFFLILILVTRWNSHFSPWSRTDRVLIGNDVQSILAGYHRTPNLLIDGIRWWHGPWIEEGVQVFRPISSYLLWIETWAGLRWGFKPVGWFGLALLTLVCCLVASLSWRFTRSRACVIVSAILAPQVIKWNWNGTQPSWWMVWYPCHHDLLMICFLLAALVCFDVWMDTFRRRDLIATWGLFLAGALSKEFMYIFPLMAGALACGKEWPDAAAKRRVLANVGAMTLSVLCLFAWRLIVLPNPYNPPAISIKHIGWNAALFLVPSFYHNLRTPEYVGLAVVISILLIAHWNIQFGRLNAILDRPFTWIPIWAVTIGILWLYCELTFPSAGQALWYLFDGSDYFARLSDLGEMIFTIYAFRLFWKYRKQERTVQALLLFVLAYAPVLTYLGWHYTLTGWFMRCAVYWPLVAKLVWIDIRDFIRQNRSKGIVLLGDSVIG